MTRIGRIHYAIGAFYIAIGTLFLLGLVGILPGGPSEFTIPAILWALAVGMIPFGVYYVLTIRRRRGLQEDRGSSR